MKKLFQLISSFLAAVLVMLGLTLVGLIVRSTLAWVVAKSYGSEAVVLTFLLLFVWIITYGVMYGTMTNRGPVR